MKVMISSFYQVRNFTPNMIPISTAQWDPKWYHDFKDKSYFFVDKRNVLNGLRCENIVFDIRDWSVLQLNNEECKRGCNQVPWSCGFMKLYYDQLSKKSFKGFMDYLEVVSATVGKLMNIKDEIAVVLLVHESPNCKCAERPVLQRWFADNGYELKEFERNSI